MFCVKVNFHKPLASEKPLLYIVSGVFFFSLGDSHTHAVCGSVLVCSSCQIGF